MSETTTTRQPSPHSVLGRLVARHPVAAFLVMVYAVNCVMPLVPVLTRPGILPLGYTPYDSLGPIFGVALPTFIVVAATRHLRHRRDLWSGTAERAGGEVGATVHGGVATATYIDRVLYRCRRGRLDGIPAGEAVRQARTVKGQPARHGPLRAVPSSRLDGRIRIKPRAASPRPRIGRRFGNILDVRTGRHVIGV